MPCLENFFLPRRRQEIGPRQQPRIKITQAVEGCLVKRACLPTRGESLCAADAINPLVLRLGNPEWEIAGERVQSTIGLEAMFMQELLRDPGESRIRTCGDLASLQ